MTVSTRSRSDSATGSADQQQAGYDDPMKLNELVCPTCGLKCMTDASYTTCASCQTMFYASQSRSVDNPLPVQQVWVQQVQIQGIQIETPPYTPHVIWVVPTGAPGSPNGPVIACGGTVSVSSPDPSGLRVINAVTHGVLVNDGCFSGLQLN